MSVIGAVHSAIDEQSQPAAAGGGASRAAAGLVEHPHRFDFFQAVRLLSRLASKDPLGGGDGARPVGHDFSPESEIVRFRALPSHSFPAAEVAGLAVGERGTEQRTRPPEMSVSFFGLTGPAGALPQHYTQTVIDRIRLKDHTLRDFLDLFNHRLISLYYRAWEKHRVAALLERAAGEGREDPITRALYCLVGLGADALRRRLELADQTLLFYSGLFAHRPRNASGLERMLSEFFGLPVSVEQFQGQWLLLELTEQTAMPDSRQPAGLNCALGVTTIAGERIWSIESKFRLRIGPVGYGQFQQLTPSGGQFIRLGQLARSYVGPELDFDVQPILSHDEVPFCQLGATGGNAPRLGWNTWACSAQRAEDADEAIFACEGRPSR